MKVVLLVFLTLLCLAKAEENNKPIDWNKFEVDDFDTLEKDTKSVYIVHFVGENCDDACQKDKEVLQQNEAKFKVHDASVQIKTGKLTKKAAKSIQVKESSAIIVFYHGHLLRVDNNGPVEHEKPIDKHIIDILSKKLIKLTDLKELDTLFAGRDRAFIFYGDESSPKFKSVSLAAKYVNHELYYTVNEDIASELSLKSKGKFYSACKEGKKTFRLHGKIVPSSVERFVDLVGSPLPRRFEREAFEEAVSKGFPVMYLKANEYEEQELLHLTLMKYEETIRSNFWVMHLADDTDSLEKEIEAFCTPEGTPQLTSVCIVDYSVGSERPPRYILTENLTEANVIKFVQNFVNGSARPHEKVEKLASKMSAKVRNLNSRTLGKFLNIDGSKVKYVIMHFTVNSTSSEELHAVEEASIEVTNPSVKFGRYNVDRNEQVEEGAGLYFGGAWNDSRLIKFEDTMAAANVKQWVDSTVQEQDKLYEEMYGSHSDL